MRPDAADTARRYDAWMARHALSETLAPLRAVVLPWVARCAPEGATAKHHALAAADLALFIFYLDDLDGPDEPRRFDDAARVLDGAAPEADASPLLRGWHGLLAEMRATGRDTTRYLADRRDALRAWRVRNDARRRGARWTVSSWLELRGTTIFMRPWMSLWELLLGCALDDTARAHTALESAVAATCRWQALYNEVASVERDRAKGETNVVLLVMRDEGLDMGEAVARVRAMAAVTRRAFDTAAQDALRALPTEAVRAYVDALRVSIDGAVAHYADRHDRYGRVAA